MIASLLTLLSAWLGILAISLPYSRHQVRLETQAINAAVVSILSAPANIEISTIAKEVLSILEGAPVDGDVVTALMSATNRDELRTVLRDRARIVSTESTAIMERRLIEAAVLIAAAAAMMIFQITRIASLSDAFRKILGQLHVVFGAFDRSATKRSSVLHEEDKETWKETREIMQRSNAILHELDFDNELLSILQRQVDLEATLRILFPMLGPYLPCERLAVAFVDQFGEVVAETAVTTAQEPKIGPGYSMQISKTSLQTVFRECRVRIMDDLEKVL